MGEVQEILHNKEFIIKWYEVKSRTKFQTIYAFNGTTDTLSHESVMCWNFGEERTPESFTLSNLAMEQILNVYSEHDICYQ